MNLSPGRSYGLFVWASLLLNLLLCSGQAAESGKLFRAGAAVVDITPANFPVIVNAMFEERVATKAYDHLHARCLALDDGADRVLIAVVDSCMLPRELIDEAKQIASKATGVPVV